MKTREEKILEQIRLQEQIQNIGINLVNCGDCGSVMFHESVVITQEMDEEDCDIQCPFCDFKSDPCDFPDYFYSGMEVNNI